MSKERLEVKKEPFADLEKIKIDILKEKIQIGLDSFENNEGQQWTSIRFEKPLLKKMLAILDSSECIEKERDEWKDTAQSCYVTNQELREQNKRYREALNSIMTLWIYLEDRTDCEWLAHKMSEEARQALEGEK